MARFESEALDARVAGDRRAGHHADRAAITHLIVASCTGFTAPGLDFQIMHAAGLAPSVERTIVGFMGALPR